MGKSCFNQKWLVDPELRWVREQTGNRHAAFCAVCKKTIDLSKMGESALKSHMKSKTHISNVDIHKNLMEGRGMPYYFPSASDQSAGGSKTQGVSTSKTTTVSSDSASTVTPCTTVNTSTTKKTSMSDYVSNNDVLKAEVLWTLRTITTHSSYISNANVGAIFREMFPDSGIASKFKCAEMKTSYLTVFGIAPVFSKLLINSIQDNFVILFDESLNKKSQVKQMDIHVRSFIDDRVTTRFFGSTFLGHATAEDMVEHFTSKVLESDLKIPDMVQISMDGPSVNWKFLDLMKKILHEDYDTSLLNIGSCGLHTVHNCFKSGAVASGWAVDSVLSSLYYLFKDSPARREDFCKIVSTTDSCHMPLKYVKHRWLENVPVCERTILIWEDVRKFVKAVQQKNLPQPGNKSFDIVSQAAGDVLFLAKIHFFMSVALTLQPFLATYQTDAPVACFLAQDLCDVIKALMRRFIKKEVLSAASSSDKVVKVDVTKNDNHLPYKKIDIGFLAERAVASSGSLERQILEYRMECKAFLIAVVKKMLDKSPLTYSLARNMACLNPRNMANNPTDCIDKFKKVLGLLTNNGKVKERDCEIVLQQFTHFLDEIPAFGSEKFLQFEKTTDRVDVLLGQCMKHGSYSKLNEVVRLLLVISHGQAGVERGFSVNKEVEVENLKGESLVAQRIICDHVNYVGGVLNVDMSTELLNSAHGARNKYETYLEDQKLEKKCEGEQKKRKHTLDEIEELKEKSKRLKQDIESLQKSADRLSEKAEHTGSLTFVTQSNSMRRTAKEKTQKLNDVEAKLNEKLQALKK